MEKTEHIKIVWDECGTAHSVRGQLIEENEAYIVLRLIDGTEIKVARSRVIKVERPGGD